jgi:SAM-dependent methyltransferase
MINPWLEISEADYVGHMRSEDVGQLPVLAGLFHDALRLFAPADVLVLGCSSGNGFEHIDPRVTRRVMGIDINPAYLQLLASRFPSPAFELSLECADVACYPFPSERFDLIHVPLVLEYVDWERLLPALVRSLRRCGILSIVVQLPSPSAPAVSLTQYPSLRKLEGLFRFVRPDTLRALAAVEGLRIESEFEIPLRQEKAFHVLYLRRPKGAQGNPAFGEADVADPSAIE